MTISFDCRGGRHLACASQAGCLGCDCHTTLLLGVQFRSSASLHPLDRAIEVTASMVPTQPGRFRQLMSDPAARVHLAAGGGLLSGIVVTSAVYVLALVIR